jgi:hypothetical protein
MLLLLALAACSGPNAADADPARDDTGADADPGGDTGDTDDIDDTDDTADTADTADDTSADSPGLPGTVEVRGAYAGEAFAFACDADDPEEVFSRSWASAVGDVTGGFACAGDAGTLTVTLLDPAVGSHADPSGGLNYFFQAADGTWLSWYDAPPTAWSATLDAVSWIDVETLQLDGSLSGAWDAAELSATFSLQMRCEGC